MSRFADQTVLVTGGTGGQGASHIRALHAEGADVVSREESWAAALEWGRDNIRVNAIHPGVVATPFITEPAAGSDAPIADFYSPEPFAVPRLGQPADITALLLFLASPHAAFITGAEYVIDGGMLGPAPQKEAA